MSEGVTVLDLPMATILQPEFRSSLRGMDLAKHLSIALFALLLYEYALTVDDEKKHFWRGPWSISHCLFFFNRYFPPIVVLFDLICFLMMNPSFQLYACGFSFWDRWLTLRHLSCQIAIPLLLVLTVFAMGIIKAILVARTWYLFPGARFIRFFIIFAFLATTGVSLAFLILSANRLEIITIRDARVFGMDVMGCRASRPPGFWKVYLPDLLMHTLLYGLTVYDIFTNPEYRNQKDFRRKLLRGGGAFYIIVLVSVGLTSLGSFLTQYAIVNIPATFAPGLLVAVSIATSRMMFGLQQAREDADSSVNAGTFEFVSMSLTNIDIVSDVFPTKKTPSSRFSTDSDVYSKGKSVSSKNRFVIGLGPIDEEKGMVGQVEERSVSSLGRVAGIWRGFTFGDVVSRAKQWKRSRW